MVSGAEPESVAALTATGEVSAAHAGRTETGSRTVRPSSLVSTSAPNAQVANGAVVRVSVSVTGCDAPGATVKSPPVTATSNPASPWTAALQCVAAESTEVNVRTVESLPTKRLNAIDGRLRSTARILGWSPATIVGSWPSR